MKFSKNQSRFSEDGNFPSKNSIFFDKNFRKSPVVNPVRSMGAENVFPKCLIRKMKFRSFKNYFQCGKRRPWNPWCLENFQCGDYSLCLSG